MRINFALLLFRRDFSASARPPDLPGPVKQCRHDWYAVIFRGKQ